MNLYSIRAHDHDQGCWKKVQFFGTQTEALKAAKAMNKIGYADVIMVYKHDFPTDKKSLVATLNLLTNTHRYTSVDLRGEDSRYLDPTTPNEQRLGEVEMIWENPE